MSGLPFLLPYTTKGSMVLNEQRFREPLLKSGSHGISGLEPKVHTWCTVGKMTAIRNTSSLKKLMQSSYLNDWEHYTGFEIRVVKSIWNKCETLPKTRKSRAAIPVISHLREYLERHRETCGKPTSGYLFVAGNGEPLNLDNLARRVIKPVLDRCGICRNASEDHRTSDHEYQRDVNSPNWKGWHAFRRGLGTNLSRLGVVPKIIQTILRHAQISTTSDRYVLPNIEDARAGMQTLEAEWERLCTDRAPNEKGKETQMPVN